MIRKTFGTSFCTSIGTTLLACLMMIGAPALSQTPVKASQVPSLDFQDEPGDSHAAEIRQVANASIVEIQQFFGQPFPDPIHFRVVGDRKDFDAALAKFGVGATQCWMVGMGTADLMVLLSPEAWPKQACEHDPNDAVAVRQLIAHELIHVYHGQFNPTRDFTGVDDLDWFIEGLAVFGSGQLTRERLDHMQAAISAGKLPTALANVWTGEDRYGFAGSLVRYVDQKWGRSTIVSLLKARSSAEALTLLKTDEKSLLAGWQASLREHAGPS